MTAGDRAWLALAAGVVAYDVMAQPGEMLSQRMDAYRQRHPILTHLVIIYLAAHLTRRWPAHVDPLHRLAQRANR